MTDKFSIYENMDALDFTALIEAAGTAPGEWPKGKKFKVDLNGKEFEVTTYFSKSQEKAKELYAVWDAAAEFKIMKTPEEIEQEIATSDPKARRDVEYRATGVFRKESPRLDRRHMQHRIEFIAAVANLISEQKTIEAIAAAAPKKKDGTLHKARVQKIALSGMVDDNRNTVCAIVARNKTDKAISITFESYPSKAGDLDAWNNDFISTYHADLPISKALELLFS